ncbi:MAG: putative nucleotidyltransferase substrate binding domain-containing protein [Gordonia sp. (in: high G+C Gram-positive bacteria)]|uniref:putative nucleotidyltransferase substrate binding domain-containing protein n=1 Tax=Gordonia sp. (in: high G+C Gram-positive bacteria) TaxID=84139 RepID=UPI0039E326DF
MNSAVPDDALAAIREAAGPDDLVGTVQTALAALPAERTEAAEAACWWSALVIETVAAAVRLIGPPAGTTWQWHITGSCGRGEGLPGADVETLIEYSGGGARGRDVQGAAARVHELLERAGLPPDGNGAIASRARCCRTAAGWTTAVEGWAADPAVDRGVVMAGLTLDSRPVESGSAGDFDIAAQMLAAAGRHVELRRAMAQDAAAVREAVPARLAVLTRRGDVVDVKRSILDPIARMARLKAVLGGSAERSTLGRLAVDDDVLPEIDWAALGRAYAAATGLRWALRRSGWPDGSRSVEVIPLREFAPHDRALLRSAGREVLGAQRVLRYVGPTEIR